MNKTELIVMLTYNDKTIDKAYETFMRCKDSKADYWGFKEEPLPLEEMKKLSSIMKFYGKKIAMEVVAYTKEECIEGAKKAVACGCDILMGTVYCDEVNEICKANNIKYMPFVGEIAGRPSVLSGSIDNMIAEAKSYVEKGVYGIDLLGYRYTGDAFELNKRIVEEVGAPICIAGSVDSFRRLDELAAISPCAFTIGSAFFENQFEKLLNH